ncbi:hypothetical protein LSAT2_019474 [Lamellibrachia satsuma]|nr:hypothetical protein LSAT2_019474 [Lamellibrachia satsuma]
MKGENIIELKEELRKASEEKKALEEESRESIVELKEELRKASEEKKALEEESRVPVLYILGRLWERDRSEDQKRHGGEWRKKELDAFGWTSWAEAAQRAADRAEWRTFVHALCDTWRPKDP